MRKIRIHGGDAFLSAAIELERARLGQGLRLDPLLECAKTLEEYLAAFQEGQKTYPSFLIGSEKGIVEGVREFRGNRDLSPQRAYETLPREIARFKRLGAGGTLRPRERTWLCDFCIKLHRGFLNEESRQWQMRRPRNPYRRYLAA